MIYLDNAATSFPKPETVYAAVDHFNRYVGANPGRAGYGSAREAEHIVTSTRTALAALLGIAESSQLVFTANATEALNLAVKGLLQSGDHVVTTAVEHNSVLRPLRALMAQRDITVSWVRCDATGTVDPDDLRSALSVPTRLICLTHASNVTGAIQDIARVSQIAREHDALLLVDAAQTAGCVPIDVEALGIDMLACAGHKGLLGPQGTGALYIRPGLGIAPLCEGGTGSFSSSDQQPRALPDQFEAGTRNTPGLAGLGAGVRFVMETGVPAIQAHDQVLTGHLLTRLAGVDGTRIYGPRDPCRQVGVVSFTMDGYPPLNLAHLLSSACDIATRSGIHCAPLVHKYVGTADSGTVRASVGYFNSLEDIDALCSALESFATKRR